MASPVLRMDESIHLNSSPGPSSGANISIDQNGLPPYAVALDLELQADDRWRGALNDIQVYHEQLTDARLKGDTEAVTQAQERVSEGMNRLSMFHVREAEEKGPIRKIITFVRGKKGEPTLVTLARGGVLIVVSPLLVGLAAVFGAGIILIGSGKVIIGLGNILTLDRFK